MAASLARPQPSHLSLPDRSLSNWDEIKFQGSGIFRHQNLSDNLPQLEDDSVVLPLIASFHYLIWEQMLGLLPATVQIHINF